MRMVTYKGRAVRKQHRTRDGLSMKVIFYEGGRPIFVPLDDWRAHAESVYYDDAAPRSEVARRISRPVVDGADGGPRSESDADGSPSPSDHLGESARNTRMASFWVMAAIAVLSLLFLLVAVF